MQAMPVLTLEDQPKLASAQRPTGPALSVCRRGEPRRPTVALTAGKCTIGSSPQCQICLPSAEVRPLQGLLTCEGGAVTATRWTAGLLLNGKEFTRATLADGDQLSVGAWELSFTTNQSSRRPVDPAEIVDRSDERQPPQCQSPAQSPWTSQAESSPSVESPPSEEPVALTRTLSSHAFADRLVLDLWVANFRTRRRAKALITGIRAARFQADALAADLSAMETELDLARAAYDSQSAHEVQLQLEVAAQRAQMEQRIAPLLDELAALRVQLDKAQTELAGQTAQCSQLSAELAACRTSEPSPTTVAQEATRYAELESALAAEREQFESLAREFQCVDAEREQLAELYRSESERAAQLERALAEQAELFAAAKSPAETPPALAPPATDAWQSIEPVADAAVPESPAVWAPFESAADESTLSPQPEPVTPSDSASIPWVLAPAPPAPQELDPEPPVPAQAESGRAWNVKGFEPSTEPVAETGSAPAQAEPNQSPAWAVPMAQQPVAEFSSTSFIDKYRHLLEGEAETPAPELGLAPLERSRAVLDDEFLSPAKAQTCAAPADESDEALEAYMENMMRRVRSNAPSYESSQAPAADPPPSSALAQSLADGDAATLQATTASSVNALEEQPFDFEAFKQTARKPAPATDLAALRELANSSARRAIASHSQRQNLESAVHKIAIALTALASSAYLMASAPGIDGWTFWAGAGTGAIGITTAVQVLLIERRRAAASRAQ